ncbi:MAG: NusG domain II-containing protein [Clostridia bacterium]|nr:NusG domain II-containing protein [Clostridia bacterium]
MKGIRFFKLADIILILAIVMILVFTYAFLNKGDSPLKATVYVDGKVHSVYLLDGKSEQTVTVGEVKIIINGDGIGIIHSDCPDKLCVKTGMLNKNGATVACVPNKIVVTVTGAKEVFDGVTG